MLTWFRTSLSSVTRADQEDIRLPSLTRADFVLAFVLAAVLGAICLRESLKVDPVLFLVEGRDVWFDGDIDRVFSVETSQSTGHASRNSLHPLYSLLTFPFVSLLRAAADVGPVNAVRIFHSMIAGAWFASFYLLLRTFRCRVPDALVFAAVAATSASAMVWFVVPETFALGSLSILPSLVLCAIPADRLRFLPFSLAGAFSLSVTVSNVSVSLLAACVRWPWRKSVLIILSSLFIVLMLAIGQKQIFPQSKFPLESLGKERKFVLTDHSGGPLYIARSFFFHTMVMPRAEPRQNRRLAGWHRTTVQHSRIGSGGTWGMVASVAWAGLLALGVYGLVASPGFPAFRLVLALALAGQFVLHLFYGYETFVFSLHFLPLLVAITALGSKTRFRPFVLTLAVVFSFSAFFNNAGQRVLAYEHVRLYHQLRPPLPPPAAP